MPLRHLITLIVDARRIFGMQRIDREKTNVFYEICPTAVGYLRSVLFDAAGIEAGGTRTNLLFTMSEST